MTGPTAIRLVSAFGSAWFWAPPVGSPAGGTIGIPVNGAAGAEPGSGAAIRADGAVADAEGPDAEG